MHQSTQEDFFGVTIPTLTVQPAKPTRLGTASFDLAGT